jgi:predicted MPP superfamily phosphohydrolase
VLKSYPNIAATFSGHTHGMQFGVDTAHYRWSPVKLMYPEWIDLYKENDQMLYVNRGFGYLGFPGRIGIFPEISVFTLRRA